MVIIMIFKMICSNLIKWWYVVYTPIARKIWPTKEEKELYEAEHPEEFEEETQDESSSKSAPAIDPSLLANENYNAATNSMSGEYGKGPLDEDAKAKLDAILKSNYNAVDPVSELLANAGTNISDNVADSTLTTDALTQEESDDALEQIRQAEEIYERLRREAEEDEAKKQAEIEAAKKNSQI